FDLEVGDDDLASQAGGGVEALAAEFSGDLADHDEAAQAGGGDVVGVAFDGGADGDQLVAVEGTAGELLTGGRDPEDDGRGRAQAAGDGHVAADGDRETGQGDLPALGAEIADLGGEAGQAGISRTRSGDGIAPGSDGDVVVEPQGHA